MLSVQEPLNAKQLPNFHCRPAKEQVKLDLLPNQWVDFLLRGLLLQLVTNQQSPVKAQKRSLDLRISSSATGYCMYTGTSLSTDTLSLELESLESTLSLSVNWSKASRFSVVRRHTRFPAFLNGNSRSNSWLAFAKSNTVPFFFGMDFKTGQNDMESDEKCRPRFYESWDGVCNVCCSGKVDFFVKRQTCKKECPAKECIACNLRCRAKDPRPYCRRPEPLLPRRKKDKNGKEIGIKVQTRSKC